ncbi:MAG TPA: hypothetical protein VGY58_11830 [Gemmataceae bacterium]|nr:hypothetical protein [Gemmataceae bacterium]
MIRHVLALPLLVAMILVLAVRADDNEKSPPKSGDREDATIRQQYLKDRFNDFKTSLLHLAQRLERSPRQEDRDRAVTLKKAIEQASKEAIDHKFETLISLLKENKSLSLNEVKDAMEQSKLLADDLHALLAILLSDDRDSQIKEEIKRLQSLIKHLDKILREEKVERANTEANRLNKKDLVDTQKKITKATESLARAMSKSGQGKGKDGKGDGQGKPKAGEPKDGQPKDGQPKNGQPKNGDKLPPPQETDGRKEIQEATEPQKQSEKNMEKEKNKEASNNLDEAIKKLEEARKRLEELLRQLREEELRRLLAKLEGRCQRMLAMQIEVYNGTVALERTIAQNDDKKANRSDEQRSLKLSDREQEIVREAETCLKLLESEGSAVAFVEIFTEARDDMLNVTRRLGKADVGSITQQTEQDIIAMLKEMIEALKRAQSPSQSQGRGGQPNRGNQSLIDLLAELKMIRSMQLRVNLRTQAYGRQYPGELANDPDIQKELENLAQRQQKIFEVTNSIARGKTENRAGQ